MNKTTDTGLLGIYLNDHLAGATAGVGLADRLAKAFRSRPGGEWMSELAREIRQDRTALLTIMDELDIPVRHYKVLAARAAELTGRGKLNGRLLSRSPLSDLVEIEMLRLGVVGKAAGWRTLRAMADTERKLNAEATYPPAARSRRATARSASSRTVLPLHSSGRSVVPDS